MWPNLQETVDLVTFTEELLNRKLHFLCSGLCLTQLCTLHSLFMRKIRMLFRTITMLWRGKDLEKWFRKIYLQLSRRSLSTFLFWSFLSNATLLAVIFCFSITSKHILQEHFLYLHECLWPLNVTTMPWLLHLAHLGSLSLLFLTCLSILKH